MFFNIGVLNNFAKFKEKQLHQSLFFNKETLAQVFSFEFCKIFKDTFLYRTLSVAASVYGAIDFKISILQPYAREVWEYLYLLFLGKPIDKIKWYIK